MLVGMTGDEGSYRTEDWKKESDSVQLVVDCFGPSDVEELVNNILQSGGPETDPRMAELVSDGQGGISWEKVREMSET